MWFKAWIIPFLIHVTMCYPRTVRVGLLLKKGDEVTESIIRYTLRSQQRTISDPQNPFSLEVVKEYADDNAYWYHQAVCRLLNQGISILVAPASSSYYSILSAYASELQLPLITPESLDVPDDFISLHSFGIQPTTTRDILSLIRHYQWENIVYLYDYDYGPEKLQQIFRLGYRVLNINVIGILRIGSPEDANNYLRKLDTSVRNGIFHVILDVNPNLARSIILRHVHDIHVRKKNFHFMLSEPTLENFWTSEVAEFGAVNVIGFIAINTSKNSAKNFKEEWMQLSPKAWTGAGANLNVSSYYYHDIALVIFKAVENTLKSLSYRTGGGSAEISIENNRRNCLDAPLNPLSFGAEITKTITKVQIPRSITGNIRFDDQEGKAFPSRKGFEFTVIQTTSDGYRVLGTTSDGQLQSVGSPVTGLPQKQPLTSNGDTLRVTTKINPPYMMLKTSSDNSSLYGNDRFEGFCKDLIDLLATELKVKYELKLVEDNEYGQFVESEGKWTGIIGEIIQGKADMAVTDLKITGVRQKVVDFTDPFEMLSFSLLMKNPHHVLPSSSTFFFLKTFTVNVWICILIALILFSILFHVITKFTGAPDSIEWTSGIWGRRFTIILNTWFAIGSSTLQGTGVYPRSISSRILSGIWWFFTLIISCLFIASMTAQLRMDSVGEMNSPQLAQLRALSLESIIAESLERGWPRIGIKYPSTVAKFLKKSSLPIYASYASFLESNPDVRVSSTEEGIVRVRNSRGGFMFFTESLSSEYAVRRKPCDLVSTNDAAYYYAGYGIATKSGSPLRAQVNAALNSVQRRGMLGHLHRKWWIDSNECKNARMHSNGNGTLKSFSGLFCILTVGFLVLLLVFAVQYSRKTQRKESRRQQLSFEDMNLDQTLPLPHPELLVEPAVVLNLPEYDKRTLL